MAPPTCDVVISEAHVEQVYAGLVRLVVQNVLSLALLLALQVGAVRALDGEGQRADTCRACAQRVKPTRGDVRGRRSGSQRIQHASRPCTFQRTLRCRGQRITDELPHTCAGTQCRIPREPGLDSEFCGRRSTLICAERVRQKVSAFYIRIQGITVQTFLCVMS